MTAQRVLIVDDSKTAQLRLKKMLKRYDVIVDVAFSAEEALGYLSYRVPVVIFLDHHMEGMDGLEALRIIKANPSTAMIPVIMYTSQSGDVYVGQARALGALDILSKEVIKPSGVEQVLRRLSIFPQSQQEAEETEQDVDQSTEATPPPSLEIAQFPEQKPPIPEAIDTPLSTHPEVEIVQMRKQVARLFEIHISDVRNQIAENSKFIIRQLAGEIKRLKEQEPHVEIPPLPVISEQANTTVSYTKFISITLLCLIFIALVVISIQLLQSQKTLTVFTKNNPERILFRANESQFLNAVNTKNLSDEPHTERRNIVNHAALLKALSWAMNIDMSFPYAQTPLGKNQVENVKNLLYKLDRAGFRGLIKLNIHFGNFCVERTNNGDWAIAKNTTPFSQCVFALDVQPEASMDDILSAHYLNFEQNAIPIQNADIGIILNIDEFKTPIRPYPIIKDTSLASQWNAIAASNNRISIELEPE